MANQMLRHLLGCSRNMYAGFEGQVKTLDVLEIWNDLQDGKQPMMKQKFSD